MKISRKALYALKAMLELALLGGEGVMSCRAVAEHQAIPVAFLEKIFLDLRRKGLVSSIRGIRGGYCLGRHPRKIAVLEILQAVGEVWEPFAEELEDGISLTLLRRMEWVFMEKFGKLYLEDLYFDVRSFQADQMKESIFTI